MHPEGACPSVSAGGWALPVLREGHPRDLGSQGCVTGQAGSQTRRPCPHAGCAAAGCGHRATPPVPGAVGRRQRLLRSTPGTAQPPLPPQSCGSPTAAAAPKATTDPAPHPPFLARWPAWQTLPAPEGSKPLAASRAGPGRAVAAALPLGPQSLRRGVGGRFPAGASCPAVTGGATPTSTPSCLDPRRLRVYSGLLPGNAT